jgi:DNA-binding CsgD family transcriptional regulator
VARWLLKCLEMGHDTTSDDFGTGAHTPERPSARARRPTGRTGLLRLVERDAERVSPDRALEYWREFADGRLTLVAHAPSDTTRLVLARPCRATRPGPLGPREQKALSLALEGYSQKYIGYELGIAPPTVTSTLASSLKRLGIASRVELTEVFGAFGDGKLEPGVGQIAACRFDLEGDTYVRFEIPLRKLEPPAGLTQAERDVVKGVLSHKSNAEIASERRTSVRTVANQLRAVYGKLGISGRCALIETC